MFLYRVVSILHEYQSAFLSGLIVTFQLTLTVWLLGILCGSALGIASARFPRLIGWPQQALAFVVGGIPAIIVLYWMHYPLQELLGVVIEPLHTAVTALLLLNTFAVAEIVRAAFSDFPVRYIRAGLAAGLTRRTIIFSIQIPLLLRQIMPGLIYVQVSILHATLFASLISVDELFRAGQRVNAQIYKPIEIYTALAVFYLSISLPLNALAAFLRSRVSVSLAQA
jgi:His/Glu/Gln/Arg/opine family amino acid ABC transporter permease subunit